MIITFCGHSDFWKNREYERKVLSFLQEKIGDIPAELYFGGYGGFDSFAYDCGKKYKMNHPNISLVFVTPYFEASRQHTHLKYQEGMYDLILYPDMANVPPRFAISRRNRYMVEKANFIIAYVEHSWGGAYQTYKYAKRKGKVIFNLAEKEFN